MAEKNDFTKLYEINVNNHVEKKRTGYTELSYLSWTYAWAEFKKYHEHANYEIKKFENGLPYVYDPNTGYMVFTSVTVDGLTHEMWLPVMDGQNKAMKSQPYQFKTKKGVRSVEQATMTDINKAIMRCLVKNIAMFGLGLYIYSGEDLPTIEAEKINEEQENIIKVTVENITKVNGSKASDINGWLYKQLGINNIKELTVEDYPSAKRLVTELLEKAKAKEEVKKEKVEA